MAGGFSQQARAQALEVAPILVELAAGQMATTLTATNKGARGVSVQIRPFQWEQSGNTDHLTPTDQLAVGPPITELGAGDTQTFRLVLRRPATGTEASYRILLDEIPPPPEPGTVRVALRLSIPVFAEPEARVAPSLTWRIVSDGNGNAELIGVNRGTRHLRIVNPMLALQQGTSLRVVPNQNPYVLPAAERSWRIEGGARLKPGLTVRLTATTEQEAVDASVMVTGRR
jgi:fimbrial chaperone protein